MAFTTLNHKIVVLHVFRLAAVGVQHSLSAVL